ncbi:hypothetical protein L1049_025533 [Liquidambar formosana]|uniref:Uncharacterized protein n=1 Tax=Liquidambar formosana TaxID=63359 RepID=A0AAP0NDU2_LIQFO
MIISSKKLAALARKWQKMAGIGRIRTITLPKPCNGLPDMGHFVVYSTDKRRFVFPLAYLSSNIFRGLFRMSEEEFGLASDGPIILPCDAATMKYVVTLVQGRVSKELEKALLLSLVSCPPCSATASVCEGLSRRRIAIHGF